MDGPGFLSSVMSITTGGVPPGARFGAGGRLIGEIGAWPPLTSGKCGSALGRSLPPLPPVNRWCSNKGDGSRVWKSGLTRTEFQLFLADPAPRVGSMPQNCRPQSSCPTIPDE